MQDRITEILAELKGMERQGMSQGGQPLTADEYTSQQVNFYDFPGIDVSVAPPADPDDDDDDDGEPLRPNILTPVSDREETSVFDAQVISSSGRPRFERLNAQQSLDRFTDKDLDINGDNRFENFIERTKAGAEKIGGGVGFAASAPLGPAAPGLMLAGASLNRKQQRENANAIMRSNNTGGAIFEFNGQVVSRAPGGRNFNGTFANTSNEEMQRLEAIAMNAVPGTFFEIPKDDDSGEFQPDPTRIKNGIFKDEQAGIMVDAFGTIHSASGRLTATHGEKGRTGVMRAALAAAGVSDYKFSDAQARQFIQTYREGRPFFGTAARMDKGTYDSKLNAFGTTATSILAGMGIRRVDPQLGTSAPEPKVPETGPPPQTGGIMTEAEPMVTDPNDGGPDEGAAAAAASRDNESDGGYSPGGTGRGRSDYQGGYSGFSSQATGDTTSGRVGFADGGVAAEPAGFVEGPPENFTEKQTVADDRPMSVPEGTFVINAAAVEFAGSDDIKSMLVNAYAKLQKKLDKSPSRVKIPTEDEIDVAVSRGEVIVPPELAKIIGYDRLEKINNRGKKEVTRRQKKAGGGFLAGKKFASGGEIYEDRIIMQEVRRKMDELLKNLPDDVRVTSRYFEDDYPATQEFYQEFARLNDADPDQAIFKMRPFSAGDELVNAPRTPTLLNLFALAEEIAHLEDKKYAVSEPITSQIIRADRRTGLDQEPGTDAFMRRQYGQYEEGGYENLENLTPQEAKEYEDFFGYNPNTKRQVFDYPEYYLRERQYAEEMRAKKFAFDVVFGSMPEKGIEDTKLGKSIQFTKDSYGTEFARYILQTASPTIQKGLFAKYPELRERYFDDRGRFIDRKIMPDDDFRMAMDAENKAVSERTLKEFEASPDDRGFVDKLLGIPRKSTFIEGYGREVFDNPEAPPYFNKGGKVPQTLPKPSPVRQKKAARQEAERMADVELRADLEEFIRDDQLARLGWNLYTSGELRLVGVPTPFDYTRVTKGEGENARETVQDEMSYRYAGIYNPIPGRDTFPVFMGEGRTRVRASDNPKAEIREYLDRVGIKPSAEVPMAAYFAEPMYITRKSRTDPEVYMADRATVMLTLAHELRHAALNYLKFEYDAPEMTRVTEERVMDYFDQKGRKQASKNNALVFAESPYIKVAERGQSAVKLSIYRKKAELYNSLATEVLKARGVPPVAQPEEKGFISRFIDGLFRESPQSKLRKGDGKPVDYESEAMQSAQF